MAQKYLNLEQAAERLGMNVADVNSMRERGELRAYRDGANWKFPAEVIEQKAEELGPQEQGPESDAQDGIEIAGDVSAEESDVLLSENELGESGIGASGTIIGDVDLGDEPVRIDSPAPSDIGLAGDSQLGQAEGDELVLSDSQLGPSDIGSAAQSGSTLNLDALDDDDLVLGDSSGSNISIGGDSGIALVDPADSGLALDEPLQLSGGSGELELGEDEAIDLGPGSDSLTDRAAESDFTLSSVEDEDDDSDSGSQVIAIEDEETGSGFGGSGSMPPMLDGEDFGPDAGVGVAAAGGLGDFDAGGLDAGPAQQPQAAAVDYSLPEAPYSIWVILALSFCVLFMSLALMMSYDLLRNMWSWEKPYALNSSLIDMICGMLGL